MPRAAMRGKNWRRKSRPGRRAKALKRLILCAFAAILLAAPSFAAERFITIASTTSTDNSGLFAHLLPIFTARTGIEVRVVARGTGQAIRLARDGDADVLLVHHRPSEEKFVAEGYGVERRDVMYNDFVIVGPAMDPAGVKGMTDVVAALERIEEAGVTFVSRGDDSGTHKAERQLWSLAGIDPSGASGRWYREAGSGMGATLNVAAGMNAYTLSDRATWIAFRNKGELAIAVEGDTRLYNEYGVIQVNPKRFPHVKAAEAKAFVDWLTSPKGQQAIDDFRIDGQQVFFPAKRPAS